MPTGEFHFQVTLEHAIDLHEGIIAATGGRSGILNHANLLSALARPYSGYYPSLSDKISALMESVVQNHGFVDGNKRTAVMLAKLIIAGSFYELVPFAKAEVINLELENLVVDLASGKIARPVVQEWFTQRLIPVAPA